MVTAIAAFIVALGAVARLMRSAHTRRPSLLDDKTAGRQESHAREPPRVGGLVIALGLVTALTILATWPPRIADAANASRVPPRLPLSFVVWTPQCCCVPRAQA